MIRKFTDAFDMNIFKIFTFFGLIPTSFLSFAQTDTTRALPQVNSKIIEYCDSQMGKKVGRGECWDLAKHALDFAAVKMSAPYDFGRKLNLNTDEVLPGDIIQYENVKLIYPNNTWKKMTKHTAVIYEIKGSKHFIVAEQNSNGKRYVIKDDVDLNYLKTGKYSIYRPE